MASWYPRQRHRPYTKTGRQGKLLATSSAIASETSSSRLTRVRNESGVNNVDVLNRLLNTLRENQVPGPQLFRLQKEFSEPLGEGGQGNVRGITKECANRYRNVDKRIAAKWPVDLIAIKQHQQRMINRNTQALNSHTSHTLVDLEEQDLSSRLRAAECEVLALSPNIFRGHPNIVQLVGWGLCLDTIENLKNECCGSVHIPLLILERAEMNLAQFLQYRLFPQRTCTSEAQVEEGYAVASQGMSNVPLQPRWPMPLRYGWRVLAQRAGFEVDPYEIVRLLCIDIGHGLQSLHENKFTHGDLKPQNVLVYKTSRKWVAKLCDFGCARGELDEGVYDDGISQLGQLQKVHYLGTPSWLPPKDEAEKDHHDYESLRKCDIYVYGLVVWSSFCLRGNPPRYPKAEYAQEDLKLLQGSTRRLRSRISRLLESAMATHDQRELKPWEHLCYGHERTTLSVTPVMNLSNPPESQKSSVTTYTPASLFGKLGYFRRTSIAKHNVQPSLSPDAKVTYNTKNWWAGNFALNGSFTAGASVLANDNNLGSTFSSPELSRLAQTLRSDSYSKGGFRPASSTALSTDDNPFSMAIFQGDNRLEDANRIFQDMELTLSSWPESSSTVDLYCYARFRSRIQLQWWQSRTPTTNILEKALKSVPAVDICTLAWLCNGPVGKSEVQTLQANYTTWRVVLDPDFLNESERLDRFLLLLQFGAHVEQKVTGAPDRHASVDSQSIFGSYIRSCRQPTLPTVTTEIRHRFDLVKNMDHISSSTKHYMTGGDGNPTFSEGSRAEEDIKSYAHIRSLVKRSPNDPGRGRHHWTLWDIVKHQVPSENDPSDRTEEVEGSDDSRPLIPLHPLPGGWKEHTRRKGSKVETSCYEESYTQSITLNEPTLSLRQIRQVKIGFLDRPEAGVCHLDLFSYMHPAMSNRNTEVFDQDTSTRFPYYDNKWFETEWETEGPQNDVLKSLSEPWQITSFSIRIPRLDFWAYIGEAFYYFLLVLKALLWLLLLIAAGAVGVALVKCQRGC
ncbi:kinase-like protein [Zopfia rhizophila CBS 207.26]|uniref:Kinase-like protein n=1 Tax=Zopfia rhizophila CBS 207.26 TaxID=1314779 RepID=A0A6A6E792_9PEZI|nr:kinase-like protein [Zopfia rhizophila CBS 207.26]